MSAARRPGHCGKKMKQTVDCLTTGRHEFYPWKGQPSGFACRLCHQTHLDDGRKWPFKSKETKK